MGSVDAGRQITAGGQACDLYAPADYLDIDLFMKPAGYADFNIVFAQGRMVLAYSASGLAAKKLPPIAEPGSLRFIRQRHPKAVANWYEILTMPGVAIGGGNSFLDPGAYRASDDFPVGGGVLQGAEPVQQPAGASGDHGPGFRRRSRQGSSIFSSPMNTMPARLRRAIRIIAMWIFPDEINLSDPAKDAYYRQNAVVVLPGLGTSRSARTIAVPGAHVAWGITLLKDAPNKQNAIKFLQLLLSPEGTSALKKNGPDPLSPAIVSSEDFRNLPEPLRR